MSNQITGEKGGKKMNKRDTYRYEIRSGNKVNYVGITNDPERRAQEHSDMDGTLRIIGSRVTRSTAEQWEEERIRTYKAHHNGNRPKYNQNDSGK